MRVQHAEDRAGDRVARRELVDEALAVGAVQRRALAAHRLGDQEALAARAGRRPRWGGTGRTRGRRASAPAARASSRPEPNEPGGLVVRDHSAAAPPVARIDRAGGERAAVVERADARRRRCERARRARPSQHVDRSGARRRRRESSRRIRRPVALPPACDDAAARCGRPRARARGRRGGRRRSGRRATRGRGSARAPPRRGPRRPSGARGRGRRRACPRGGVPGESSTRERGGGAALRPVGRGLGQRPGGDERDARALAGGGQRGEEPGRAGAHDDEVGSACAHTALRYRA